MVTVIQASVRQSKINRHQPVAVLIGEVETYAIRAWGMTPVNLHVLYMSPPPRSAGARIPDLEVIAKVR